MPQKNTEIIIKTLNKLKKNELEQRQKAAEKAFLNLGITFNVYGNSNAEEKIFPFDIIPRIIDSKEWEYIEKGLKQRITALNLFINDIYTEKKIIKDKIIPEDLILSCESYKKIYEELTPPHKIWCHITGTDLVRDKDGQIYVLEDNLRCPSGISYVFENRQMTKKTFPQIFETLKVRPVEDYPVRLFEMLNFLAGEKTNNPVVCVLTPGIYNSAYFEHSFLARQMGVELVEGSDLLVKDDKVFMKTTKGLQKVDVIYRRLDDSYLDPLVFNKDSLLGVPGLLNAYKKGNVALVNAPGAGIADDKAIYSFVPEIIKYYLGEEAIIPNVPTYLCYKEKDLSYVLENIKDLVVKTVDGAGGYGMLIGPKSTGEEISEFREKVKANPRKYIAQPVISLSRVPVMADNNFEGRHVDLRPYIIYGKDIFVLPGGLTRVALKKGSLVVNSSQGGGSKDTWVIA
ncbi:MAG: circularly permuted type 2 ATP-grasp protein [bacterium]